LNAGYTSRKAEIEEAIVALKEFILIHQLFISDRIGKIINKDFHTPEDGVMIYGAQWIIFSILNQDGIKEGNRNRFHSKKEEQK
jgi:hypothetical protein